MIHPPHSTNVYRERTASMLILNHARRTCERCRKHISVGQFAPGDDLCLKCRRRT